MIDDILEAPKYRDEIRPRGGLLRTREFTMKDLYTFDATSDSARNTYAQVQDAYALFFRSLRLPFVRVEADSGDMGGDLSHEYHLPVSVGDDLVATCCRCNYAANAEMLRNQFHQKEALNLDTIATRDWDWGVRRGISKDRMTLINAWMPLHLSKRIDGACLTGVTGRAVQAVVPELDLSVDNPLSLWLDTIRDWTRQPIQQRSAARNPRVLNMVDYRLTADSNFPLREGSDVWRTSHRSSHFPQTVMVHASDGRHFDFLGDANGGNCPRCGEGALRLEKALEIGHTFYLGTRYSDRLGATVSLPEYATDKMASAIPQLVPLQMGCYGIGVSRLIGAVAEYFSDDRGLQWPRAIAPFEVAILCGPDLTAEGIQIYDMIAGNSNSQAVDVVLDDRTVSLPWKMKDADLVGYPVIVIVGKHWKTQGCIEVQCRQLRTRTLVDSGTVKAVVYDLLKNLE